MNQFPENAVDLINEHLGGFNQAMGIRCVQAASNELIAELEIKSSHLQPYGIVHGGVYASMIETLCSTGAALNVILEGKSAVGLENTTSFLRAVRSGTLRCTARPILKGRRSHVWEAHVTDDQNRTVATGRVRLIILESGAEADGMAVGLETGLT
ncbi:MAG: PaaI family thioesterase [Desulfatirhabdiaceae bacterium]